MIAPTDAGRPVSEAVGPGTRPAPGILGIFDRWSRADHIRLHTGEMTAQEMRSVLAVLGAVRAEVARLPKALSATCSAPAGDAAEIERLRRELAAEVDAAEVQRARFRRLLVAFHDATRRPLGVTPASGDEFYDWRMAHAAEQCRPRVGTEAERRERPEVRLLEAQREKTVAIGMLDGHASVVRQIERERAAAETALAKARAAIDPEAIITAVCERVGIKPTGQVAHQLRIALEGALAAQPSGGENVDR